ncbi:hypothetical protein ACTXT7_001105 [Hymenolepis weldensis]
MVKDMIKPSMQTSVKSEVASMTIIGAHRVWDILVREAPRCYFFVQGEHLKTLRCGQCALPASQRSKN